MEQRPNCTINLLTLLLNAVSLQKIHCKLAIVENLQLAKKKKKKETTEPVCPIGMRFHWGHRPDKCSFRKKYISLMCKFNGPPKGHIFSVFFFFNCVWLAWHESMSEIHLHYKTSLIWTCELLNVLVLWPPKVNIFFIGFVLFCTIFTSISSTALLKSMGKKYPILALLTCFYCYKISYTCRGSTEVFVVKEWSWSRLPPMCQNVNKWLKWP